MTTNSRVGRGFRGHFLTACVVAALIAPRLWRFFYPRAMFGDAPYLDIIACISRGLRPHIDFVHTHFVFPEALLGLIYALTWPSYRVTEAVTGLVVTATAGLIYLLGADLRSRRVGAIAALLYAAHPLFLLFHVFEKETYQALIGCLVALVMWRKAPGVRRTLYTAALLALGFVTKLDFSFVAAALCLYVLIVERRVKQAFLLGGAFALLILAISAAYASLWGMESLRQIYLFHFFKGAKFATGAKFTKWALSAGYLFFMSLASIPYLVKLDRNKIWLLIAWIAGPTLFLAVVSDTLWEHNVITVLPPLCLLSAVFADGAVGSITSFIKGGSTGGASRRGFVYGAATLSALLALTSWYLWAMHKMKISLGNADRGQIARVADAVKKHSMKGDIIIAPPVIAAESNRTDIVHNREVYPVYKWAMERVDEVGFRKAREEALKLDFRRLYRKTSHIWLDEAWRAIAHRSAAVVVGDERSSFEPFQPGGWAMRAGGYRKVYSEGDFTVWARGG